MWEFIGFTALVVSIVAVALVKGCRSAIKAQQADLDDLWQKLANTEKSSDATVEKRALRPPPQAPAKPSAVEELLRRRTTLAAPPPERAPEIEQKGSGALKPAPQIERKALDALEPALEEQPIRQPAEPLLPRFDRESWAKLEQKLGTEWITWVGAVVLFLAAGLFVKYAFDHKWLGPWARVILGVVAGIAVVAAGERFIRRKMRAFGQGLIGTGLAILYVSLYAASGLYHLLPHSATFALMVLVTTGGMVLAVVHDAIAVSFLAVLGGFLTPVLLRTGQDAREALFSYLLLLDVGVLGVAFFKRWRALDVLAFTGTVALFTGWYIQFHDAATYSMVPTLLWLGAFYVVFLVQPFVYHLRLATPIVGERFFLAVTNAMGMFGGAYTVLHPAHKHTLGFIAIGMSVSYLILGTLTRKRIKSDERAVFGFTALSVALLTIAVPIHLDFHGVTIAWAIEAPLLLYLAYKYDYFPVRAGCLIPLALAAGRIFTTHWPLHSEAFTPLLNTNFATAIFVALAGAAYAVVHHIQKKNSTHPDRILKIATAIASAFLALVVTHIEIWQWLQLSDRDQLVRWSAALVWVLGAAGFLAAGFKLRSEHARASGFVALAIAGALCVWDYALPFTKDFSIVFNGRFIASLAAIAVVFAYAVAYLRFQEICLPVEKRLVNILFGIGILLLAVLSSVESHQWLVLNDYHYAARCLLPFLWVAGTAGSLFAGIKLRSVGLRTMGLAMLAIAGILAALGYRHRIDSDYLLLLNWRFIAALATTLMVFAHAATLRKRHDLCEPSEKDIPEALYGIGILLLAILTSWETRIWLVAHEHHYLARCLLPLIWIAAAAGYLAVGMKLRMTGLRTAGITSLFVATLFAAHAYTFDMHPGYYLYLNGRFAAALALLVMAFAHAFALRNLPHISTKDEVSFAKVLYGIVVAWLFVLLNVETYLYFSKTISDPERARWTTQMALSIIWGAYAAAMLAVGFWRNVRLLRFCALALFGATALKLVLVDMARVEEVYRIISFFVLGILMIAASYLYHRVEKRLFTAEETKEQPQ